MKKHVLLIQPRNTLLNNIYPPLNLIQLGSYIKENGYKVKIITCPTEKDHIKKVLDACEDAFIVGITILTPEIPDAIEIAKHIKNKYNIPIVWGGWHVTLFSKQVANSNLSDKIIVDEGEEKFLEVIKEYEDNKRKSNNKNIILINFKKLDMNTLPLPDYSIVKNLEIYINSKLTDKFLEYENRIIRWLPYQASRGCPGKCKFCINVVTQNRQWRKKDAIKVIDEIEALTKKYNLNHIKIIDDNFFVNTKWVREIAEGLISKNINVTWDAECRADYIRDRKVDSNLLALCKRSGLVQLTFGIESGSQSSLDRMSKEVTPDQNYNAVKMVTEQGITCRCSFVLDIPGDKKIDILKTVSFINKIRKLPKTSCGVHTYRPYPKSELCEELIRQNILKQPKTFEEWADQEMIELYTYTDAKRKWQKNYKLSNKVSFYQNLESGFWLRPHQIKNIFIKIINIIFMKIAYIRNRLLFFGFSFDRKLYILFRDLYFKFQHKKKEIK